MPKYTKEQIEKELAALEQTEAQAASFYLRQELRRREKAGRPLSGKALTGAERQARYRTKNKS